jgi:hypothetical protein
VLNTLPTYGKMNCGRRRAIAASRGVEG